MSEASEQLRNHQEQLDADGIMVGVSRQAVDEVLAENSRMLLALKTIAARRDDLAAISKNDYDSGYELATEMCCDIADEALNPPQ